MSERLNDLRRQRAMVQEQLAWLDREISKETGEALTTPAVPLSAAITPAPGTAPAPGASGDKPVLSQGEIDAEADRILAQYRPRAGSSQPNATRGIIYAFLAGLLLLATSFGAWLLLRSIQ
ncbi:MAG TPA: hypothetical protein VG734_16150 [Lacunisphaera sp.]|nr:hypothetical protein [Lacunisphaera sp.]